MHVAKHVLAVLAVLLIASAVAFSQTSWQEHRQRADSFSEAGQADSALVCAVQALAGYRQSTMETDTVLAALVLELGTCHFNLQEYLSADSLWQASLDMLGQLLPDHDPAVLENLRWLGYLCLLRGDYGRSEPILLRQIDAFKGSPAPDTARVLRAYLQKGVLCMNQGRIDDAEKAYRAGLVLIEANPAPHVEMAANFRNNLANLFRYQNRPEDARTILEAQIEAADPVDDAGMYLLVAAYHNLAEVYVDLGQNELAEQAFRQAIDKDQEFHGEGNYTASFHMTSLGNLFMDMGRFEDAAEQYELALTIKRTSVERSDRAVANTLLMYGLCEYSLGHLTRAMELSLESFDIRHANFVRNYWVLTEDRALLYSRQMRSAANAFLLPALDSTGWSPEVYRKAADVVLSAKGQVSDGVFQRQQALIAGDDPPVVDLLERYQSALQSASGLYAHGPGQRGPEDYSRRLDSLTQLIDELEGGLALESARFRDLAAGRQVSLESVRKALPRGAVLVEYMKYRRSNATMDDGEDRYLVLVIRGDADPVLMDLAAAEALDSEVAEVRELYRTMAQSWPLVPDSAVRKSRELYESFYATLIKPVEGLLEGAELVLIAPDASLNLISYAALREGDQPYLIERFPIHYLSAGRDLLRLQSEFTPAEGLMLLGDIDYDATEEERLDELLATDAKLAGTRSSSGAGSFDRLYPLPYTRREVQQLSAIWDRQHTRPATMLTGAAAAEQSFKKYGPGHRIIHCATHGFFDPGVSNSAGHEAADQGGNPLLRSGLFLAGANLTRAGREREADDGYLTAWEVTAMDLHGTEWVVLSACESGLGQVQTGEGVYGLRRAFQMAGVRTVISSLWPVPDKKTAALMESLYSSQQPDLALRMQEICLSQIDQLRSSGQSDNPFCWAAFIAVGDWVVH